MEKVSISFRDRHIVTSKREVKCEVQETDLRNTQNDHVFLSDWERQRNGHKAEEGRQFIEKITSSFRLG